MIADMNRLADLSARSRDVLLGEVVEGADDEPRERPPHPA